MEDVTIGEDTLISTTRASELSGYSKDYIGQLCREDKIECRRVSGHWYIDEEGLKDYQENGVSTDIKKKNNTSKSSLGMKIGNVRDDTFKYDGKEYIATSRAAAITGYAQDYIGQLARSAELEARKVGRRWFVEKESLINHKKHNDGLLAQVQAQASGLHSKDNGVSPNSAEENVAGSTSVSIKTDIEPGDINFNVRYVAESNPEIPSSIEGTKITARDIPYPSRDISSTHNRIKKVEDIDIRPLPKKTSKAIVQAAPVIEPRNKVARQRESYKDIEDTTDVFVSDLQERRGVSIVKVLGILILVSILTGSGFYLYSFGLPNLTAEANMLKDSAFLDVLQDKYGDLIPGKEYTYSTDS